MARNAPSPKPPPAAPVTVTGEGGRPPLPLRPPLSSGRLIGVDLARGLAMFGMYAAHVGPEPSEGGVLGFLMETARGRSSALFAVLAGFSLVIITGRPRPRTGRAGRQAVGRIVLRALVLVAVGFALAALDTSVDVILAYYGLTFLAVLPLYRLSAKALAIAAAVGALVLPQMLYMIHQSIDEGRWADIVISWDPLARITDTDGLLDLLFTGEYPVLTWAPFMIAGMAVARLDLTRARIRSGLALTGAALAVLGYGGSWLALRLVPNAGAAIAAATDGGSPSSAWWSDAVGEPVTHTPVWLLVAAPHSQTTASILGNTGVALVVLALCLIATARMPRFTRLTTPVCAVGAMSLTAYVLHIIAIRVLGTDSQDFPELPVLLGFIAAAMLLAWAWSRVFRRGPLEYLLHTTTRLARHIR
ncbi:DUF418 domain-containing protein [Streptomyces coeruleorubidus]|uniref:DUF418 domain-containing protein n=1 Tax=Streptomyces coeruleorubidus TaxID=116188 RepID=A0ABZ0KN68_STRC4|nr:DUF418 domain-containing protein [Streptomyces coeruleorubidus]WOT39046.1 DUF418 domain-containing protein [Streptomyces coeruleorubidus]